MRQLTGNRVLGMVVPKAGDVQRDHLRPRSLHLCNFIRHALRQIHAARADAGEHQIGGAVIALNHLIGNAVDRAPHGALIHNFGFFLLHRCPSFCRTTKNGFSHLWRETENLQSECGYSYRVLSINFIRTPCCTHGSSLKVQNIWYLLYTFFKFL